MADILIRMEMPKGCGVCPLNMGAYYCAGLKRYVVEEEHVWMGSNYRRLKDCPLVELPEHGDLISLKDAKTVIDRFLGYLDEEMIYRIKYKLNQDCTVIVPASSDGI